MWICRYCAAHVNEDVLTCPVCETTAPTRLQQELAHHISDEVNTAPSRGQIGWLTHVALPVLRKRAQSPWSWAMFGLVIGLSCGVVRSRTTPNFTTPRGGLLQVIVCGVALGLVFGLLGILLRLRREHWSKDTHPVEVGGILGFFVVLILAVIDAFLNHPGWESLYYLLSNSIFIVGLGLFFALMGSFLGLIVVPCLKLLAMPQVQRFRPEAPMHKLPPHLHRAESDSIRLPAIPSDAESLDRIVAPEDRLALPNNADISSPDSSMDCIHKRFVKETTPHRMMPECPLWEDDRIVLLRGEIDDRVANLAVAMLLYLNHVAAHEPIHLYIDSSGGSVTAGFAILDTMDHIVAPVYTHCIGEAHGMAGLILAHGSRGNRFGCMDIRCSFVPVTAAKANSKSQAHLEKTTQIVIQKLALDTGQNQDTIAEDIESWLTLDAGQAVVYGLIDVVVE